MFWEITEKMDVNIYSLVLSKCNTIVQASENTLTNYTLLYFFGIFAFMPLVPLVDRQTGNMGEESGV